MTLYRFARPGGVEHDCREEDLPQWIGPELWLGDRRVERWNADAADAYAHAAVDRVRQLGAAGYAVDAERYCLDQPDPFRAAALASLIAIHAAEKAGGEVAVRRERAAQAQFFRDSVLS